MNILTESVIFELLASGNKYPIDFDDAWMWLGWKRKSSAVNSFEGCGFNRDLNYTYRFYEESVERETMNIQQQIFSTHLKTKMLTVDCFKIWAKSINNTKGRKVLSHFLDCEKKYQETLTHQ